MERLCFVVMRSFFGSVLVAGSLLFFGCPTGNPNACTPTNCTGCCDSNGQCQSGLALTACGSSGGTCAVCSVSDTCSFGRCTPMGPFVTSGGSAGGDSGGGAAGGSTAGGSSAGGTTGGGSAGGSTAGGSTAGGAVGGGSAGGSGGGMIDAGTPNPCAGTLSLCSTQCRDLSADPENCGACGRVCGQGQVCNHGTCGVLPDDCTMQSQGCGAGYFCDPVTKKCLTGCRLSTDCPMGASCNQGTCGCPTGQHACGQSCVSDTSTSSCGTRCAVCPSPANSALMCTAGTCGFTCSTGFREQNGLCVDIDECATNNGGCSTNGTCTNTPGSRTCA